MIAGLQIFDIVIIVLLIVMTFRGGLSGILVQFASMISLGLGWFVASRYFTQLEPVFSKLGNLSKPVAIIVLFLATVIIVKLAARLIRSFVSSTPLREFDKQMGALLGFVKGLFLCLILTYFAVVGTEKTRQMVFDSQSGKYFIQIIQALGNVMPNDVRHNVFKEQLAQFDELVKDISLNSTNKSLTNTISKDIDALKDKLKKAVIVPGSEQAPESGASGNSGTTKQTNSPENNSTNNNSSTTPQSADPFTALLSSISSMFSSKKSSSGAPVNTAPAPSVNSEYYESNNGLLNSSNNLNNNSYFGGSSYSLKNYPGSTVNSEYNTSSSTNNTSITTNSTINSSTNSSTAPAYDFSSTISSIKNVTDLANQMAIDFQNAQKQLGSNTKENQGFRINFSGTNTATTSETGTLVPQTDSKSTNTTNSSNSSNYNFNRRGGGSSVIDQPSVAPSMVAPNF